MKILGDFADENRSIINASWRFAMRVGMMAYYYDESKSSMRGRRETGDGWRRPMPMRRGMARAISRVAALK